MKSMEKSKLINFLKLLFGAGILLADLLCIAYFKDSNEVTAVGLIAILITIGFFIFKTPNEFESGYKLWSLTLGIIAAFQGAAVFFVWGSICIISNINALIGLIPLMILSYSCLQVVSDYI